jgi:hypothetical protein
MSDVPDIAAVLSELPSAKQIAIEAIASGATQAEAAVEAGVTRETVNRWVGHDSDFQASLRNYRSALIAEHADRARRIRGKAFVVIERHLTGDVPLAAALAIVRAIPVPAAERPDINGLPPGAQLMPTDNEVWEQLEAYRRAALESDRQAAHQ